MKREFKTLREAWEITKRHGLGRPHTGCEPFEIADALLTLEEKNAELLEACEDAYKYLDRPYTSGMGNTEILDKLSKAISKATERMK